MIGIGDAIEFCGPPEAYARAAVYEGSVVLVLLIDLSGGLEVRE